LCSLCRLGVINLDLDRLRGFVTELPEGYDQRADDLGRFLAFLGVDRDTRRLRNRRRGDRLASGSASLQFLRACKQPLVLAPLLRTDLLALSL
jgi:hypothetical protein